MKRSVRGHEEMTHSGCNFLTHNQWVCWDYWYFFIYVEILDILRLKKLHVPGSRSRAVVSAEAVEDSDDADDNGV